MIHYVLGEIFFGGQTTNPWLSVDWNQRLRKGVAVASLSTPLTGDLDFCAPSVPSSGINAIVLNSCSWSRTEASVTTQRLTDLGVAVTDLVRPEVIVVGELAIVGSCSKHVELARTLSREHADKIRILYLNHPQIPTSTLKDLREDFEIVVELGRDLPRARRGIYSPGSFYDASRRVGVGAVLCLNEGISEWEPTIQAGGTVR